MTPEQELIQAARGGDRAALAKLVGAIKDLVFNLAVRMLGNPADAEDATQEILVRVMRGLSTFRGESQFRTWVYQVASNYLLTARKREAERRHERLDDLARSLAEGLVDGDPPLDDQLLVREAKLTCTSLMLLGLDRPHRLAFVLGEVLDLPADEGAAILEVSAEAFRKRLSRARQKMAEFTSTTCGLVEPSLPCRCGKQMARRVRLGLFDPEKCSFTTLPTQPPPSVSDEDAVEAIDALERALAVFRGHPSYAASDAVTNGLRELLESGPFAD